MTNRNSSSLAGLQIRDDNVFGKKAIVYDTATGLEWLNILLSGTKSYDDMIGADGTSEFAPDRDFSGFRYATMAEVKTLWLNAGIPTEYFFYGLDSSGHNIGTYETNNSTVVDAARALQNLIGHTLTQVIPPHLNAGGWITRGLATHPKGIGLPSLETCTPGTGFCGGSSFPILRAHFGDVMAPPIQTLIGYHHWLVRAALKRRFSIGTMRMKSKGLGKSQVQKRRGV